MAENLSQEAQSRKRSSTNRRAAVRYSCPLATTGKVYASSDCEFQRAWIHDVSKVGLGIEVARPLDIGTFVTVHIAGQQRVYQLACHIAHATHKLDGNWIVGCEFVQPLDDDTLDDILQI